MRKLICSLIVVVVTGVLAAQETTQSPPAEVQPRTSEARPPTGDAFSVAIAESALDQFREGLVGMSQRRVMSTLDRRTFPDYDRFASELTSVFNRYDSLRVYAHILQTTTQGPRGIATAEFTMEATPINTVEPPLRRSTELRFTFARVGKDWKVVDIQPRAFFESF